MHLTRLHDKLTLLLWRVRRLDGMDERRNHTEVGDNGSGPRRGAGGRGRLQRRNWNATLFTVTDFRCDCFGNIQSDQTTTSTRRW